MSEFIHNFWFIQAIGATGLIISLVGWNSKSRMRILKFQSINFVLLIIHYILLSAYAGAILCGITLSRNLIFMKKDQKDWANHPAWLYLFMVLSASGALLDWKGWITVLPAIGVVFGTYSMSQKEPSDMRLYMFFACLTWIPYTIVVASYSGLVGQVVAAVAIAIGMYRHDRKKDNTTATIH